MKRGFEIVRIRRWRIDGVVNLAKNIAKKFLGRPAALVLPQLLQQLRRPAPCSRPRSRAVLRRRCRDDRRGSNAACPGLAEGQGLDARLELLPVLLRLGQQEVPKVRAAAAGLSEASQHAGHNGQHRALVHGAQPAQPAGLALQAVNRLSTQRGQYRHYVRWFESACTWQRMVHRHGTPPRLHQIFPQRCEHGHDHRSHSAADHQDHDHDLRPP